MANYYCVNSGDLFINGEIKELSVNNGTDLKIQAVGSGSYKLVGKLTKDSEYSTITVVGLNGLPVKDSIDDSDIYVADVSGLYSVSVSDVSGFEKIYAKIG